MSGELDLVLLGISHRSATVEVRERCALSSEELGRRLALVRAIDDVQEAFLVSTCNRTELLVVTARPDVATERLREALREAVFHAAPREAVYGFQGLEAVIHLFRVSAGLDSLILGESQIIAQVKSAMAVAREAGSIDRVLGPLLQQALQTGKRVRAETTVGRGTLSVARAGVQVAGHVVGRFDDVGALIVGAGDTARLVAQNLQERHTARIEFVNRTEAHAREAAAAFGAQAYGLDRLVERIPHADVLVCCVEGAPDLITAEHFTRRTLGRRDRPLVLVDLSVPRAIHHDVRGLKNVIAYDLDDIAKVVEDNQRERQRASEEAAPILVAEVHKFLSLRAYATFGPTISRLKERFDTVREEELDTVVGAHSSPEVVKLAHRLTGHLLDVALDELKQNARRAIEPESLDRAYQRFLDGQ